MESKNPNPKFILFSSRFFANAHQHICKSQRNSQRLFCKRADFFQPQIVKITLMILILFIILNKILTLNTKKMKANPPPMKSGLKITKLTFLFLTILLINNCKDRNEETKPDCGCDSNVTQTIPESANLLGTIYYKIQLDPNDSYYNNKFWITYTEQNCGNCIHHMVVCNDSLLPQEIINLKNTGGSLTVKFAGNLKNICEKINAPADYTYENITLTPIQTQ